VKVAAVTDQLPLTNLLRQYRAGDADATRQIFEYYAQRLCRVAQQHLSARVQARADGEDVVQSVFRTFFLRDAQGEFRINNSLQLWRLLVTITLRKARKAWRLNTAEQRDVQREAEQRCGDDWLFTALSREPTVVEALVLADEINSLLDGLSAEHVRVLELRMAGYSPTDAAREIGISRQAVYRLLNVLQERLERSVMAVGE
jgi:RNA polymerase sigma-70 factor (ECF subfamily)